MTEESREELLERIRELENRLLEAEETLRALRSGEVDAIVAQGPEGERIYTLKGADEAYRVLVEQMSEGALTLSTEGLILFSNERFAELMGQPLERVIGARIQDFVAATDGPLFAAILDQSALGAAKGELKLTAAEEELPAYVSASRVEFDSQVCIGVIVTDLREQKRSQEIVVAEHLARSIVDQAAEAIVVVEPQGRIIRASRAADRMAGVAVRGRDFDRVFGLELERILAAAAERGSVSGFEATANLHSGPTEVLVSAAQLIGGDGRLVGCVLSLTDITARKRIETSLRESEARERRRAAELEALMEAVPAAILITHDPECGKMVGNRKAHELLRVPAGANLSMAATDRPSHCKLLRHGKVLEPEELPMCQAASGGQEVWETEIDVAFEDGTQTSLLGSVVPLVDENGKPRGAIGAYLDVTERKRLDERLLEAQKMESVAVLAGGIAHDFNNLLTGVIGNASLALDVVRATAPERPFLQSIMRSAERAADLTRQLLAYAGKGRFIIGRVNLSELVREMCDLLKASVTSPAELRLELEDNLPPVEADSGQMQQVVMNLVLNAFEAVGNAPGQITIRTGTRSVDEEFAKQARLSLPAGAYVCLEVTDTGCGMDGATRGRIFEPFFTTKFQGRGLGLAAVQGVVKAHGGAVMVYSTEGSGSQFTVLMPAANPAEASRKSEIVARMQDLSGHGTVLVVDDEAGVRAVAERTLQRFGYTVLVAENGREALKIFAAMPEQIGLVLLDLTMPGMSGEETLKRIRAIRKDVPVLLSSGYNQIEAIRRFTAEGLSGFIGKPYSAAALAEKVKSVWAR